MSATVLRTVAVCWLLIQVMQRNNKDLHRAENVKQIRTVVKMFSDFIPTGCQ